VCNDDCARHNAAGTAQSRSRGDDFPMVGLSRVVLEELGGVEADVVHLAAVEEHLVPVSGGQWNPSILKEKKHVTITVESHDIVKLQNAFEKKTCNNTVEFHGTVELQKSSLQ